MAAIMLCAAGAQNQVPGPKGWPSFKTKVAGVIAAYGLAGAKGSQTVDAAVYTGYVSLDDFIAKNDAQLKSAAGVHVIDEKNITICGGEPAWEAEYSHQGVATATSKVTIVSKQVVAVKGSYTYVASYVRPESAPARPEADRWIHNFCARAD